jgi:DNA-binding NarL/FixJ family response regulator
VIGCRERAREALTWAIAQHSGLSVARVWPLELAVATGAEPDTAAVVLDGYPSGPELRAMADVTTARTELGVLVLGPLEPTLDVLIALASGAFGYLGSGSTAAAIAAAVDRLLAGDAVLPAAVSSALLELLRRGGRGIVVDGLDGQPVELTNREWEALVLLRQGHSTAEIASRFVVSNGTVRTHVAALIHKLGAHDRRSLGVSQGRYLDRNGSPPAPHRGGNGGSGALAHASHA